MSEQQEKKTTLGEPMYVESLMTKEEWIQRMIDFPMTSHKRPGGVNLSATNSFKWRFGMGKTLSQQEIDNINGNLDYLLKKVKK